jgi:hypothetical protein
VVASSAGTRLASTAVRKKSGQADDQPGIGGHLQALPNLPSACSSPAVAASITWPRPSSATNSSSAPTPESRSPRRLSRSSGGAPFAQARW